MHENESHAGQIQAGTGFLVRRPISALDQISCGGRCPPGCLR